MEKKTRIINAKTGREIRVSKKLFSNEFLLDKNGKRIEVDEVESIAYYFSLSNYPSGDLDSFEIKKASNVLEKYMKCYLLGIRTDILSVHSLIKEKMRSYKRHRFIIKTHPLFKKTNKTKIFEKLTKLIEIPLKSIEQSLKKNSAKFKRSETEFLEFLKRSEQGIETSESSNEKFKNSFDDIFLEFESGDEKDSEDPFLKPLEEHSKSVNSEVDKFLETIEEVDRKGSAETNDENEEKKEEEQEGEEEELAKDKEEVERAFTTPLPKQNDDSESINTALEYLTQFKKIKSYLEINLSDAEKCDFETRVPKYIYELLEEIRRREKVLRSMYYKLTDLESTIEEENMSRKEFQDNGSWKRNSQYNNPTKEELGFLGDRIRSLEVQEFLDSRYFELFQTHESGSLDELVSPLEDSHKMKTLRNLTSSSDVDIKSSKDEKSFGHITTEDLLICLRTKEKELESKRKELKHKDLEIRKLQTSLGETIAEHEEKSLERSQFEKRVNIMETTIADKTKEFEEKKRRGDEKYTQLVTSKHEMQRMYNEKLEELLRNHKDEMTEKTKRLEENQMTISQISSEMDELESSRERYERERAEQMKKISDVQSVLEGVRTESQGKIDSLREEIARVKDEYESQKKRVENLSESIVVHQSSKDELSRRIELLSVELGMAQANVTEAQRKYEKGMRFVSSVVHLVDEKDMRIAKLEEILQNMVRSRLKEYSAEERKD